MKKISKKPLTPKQRENKIGKIVARKLDARITFLDDKNSNLTKRIKKIEEDWSMVKAQIRRLEVVTGVNK